MPFILEERGNGIANMRTTTAGRSTNQAGQEMQTSTVRSSMGGKQYVHQKNAGEEYGRPNFGTQLVTRARKDAKLLSRGDRRIVGAIVIAKKIKRTASPSGRRLIWRPPRPADPHASGGASITTFILKIGTPPIWWETDPFARRWECPQEERTGEQESADVRTRIPSRSQLCRDLNLILVTLGILEKAAVI